MISLSDGLLIADAQAFAAHFAGGFIRIFTGAPPATSSAAETGTLLGVVSVDGTGTGLQFTAAVAYTFNPAGDRWAFTGLANGNAGYFRLVAPGDTGALSSTEKRIDGTIGVTASGSDMEWDSTAITTGATYTLDSFVYTVHPLPRT